jgi:hypothetical protein
VRAAGLVARRVGDAVHDVGAPPPQPLRFLASRPAHCATARRKNVLAPTAVATGTRGAEVVQGIGSAVGDRDDVVDIGGESATTPAGAAV